MSGWELVEVKEAHIGGEGLEGLVWGRRMVRRRVSAGIVGMTVSE